MSKISLNREQLYEMVWKNSVKSLSEKYDISDNGLRKACKSRNIPLPGNGYWSKLKFNKPVVKIPLPKDKTQYKNYDLWTKDDPERPSNDVLNSNFDERKKRIEDVSKALKSVKILKQNSSKMDPLVFNTKQFYEKVEKKDWEERHRYTEKHDMLHLSVSSKQVNRALLIFENLIRLLKERGHTIIDFQSTNYAVVKDQKIKLRLREKNTESYTQGRWGRERVLTPNGLFCFSVGENWRNTEFVDKLSEKIEDQLFKIIAKLESIADKEITWELKREIERIEREEKERKEKEYRAKQENELKNFKNLFQLAKQHKKAEDIREYIRIFEKNAIETNTLTEEKKTG